MKIFQQLVTITARKRGFHLITNEIFHAIPLHEINIGMCQIFIQHTSASLAINENADATVRKDFETFLIKLFLKMILIICTTLKEAMICPHT